MNLRNLMKFARWMDSRGVWGKYKQRMRKRPGSRRLALMDCDDREILSHSFEWIQAPEGYLYWLELNNQWKDYIDRPSQGLWKDLDRLMAARVAKFKEIREELARLKARAEGEK